MASLVTDAIFPTPYLMPLLGVLLLEFCNTFWAQKNRIMSLPHCECDVMLNAFILTHYHSVPDGQMETEILSNLSSSLH